jgi:hypothetical protein
MRDQVLRLVWAAGTVVACLEGAAPGSRIVNSLANDTSVPLKDIQQVVTTTAGPRTENEIHRLQILHAAGPQQDQVIQTSASRDLELEIKTFEGLGRGLKRYNSGHFPADTTGAAGPDHFVEWVNQAFVVFRKDTQEIVYGPTDGRMLWSKFATGNALAKRCGETNSGDPIVLYDRLASRWVLSQFSFDGYKPPYLQCIAVSTTSDPLGTYHRYAFQFDGFNDYGKLGVWPDAYYGSFNMFSSPARDATRKGSEACAFERSKMLLGQPARMICFPVNRQGLLPSDLDGTKLPPQNTPNYFLALGPNGLDSWALNVDWKNPTGSRLGQPNQVIGVKSYAPACGSKDCLVIPQKDSANLLDSMGDRLMYRMAYRNFGDHQSLTVNHAVTVPADENSNATTTAFRWYEIRITGNVLRVFLSGSYRPSVISRWMASVAQDKLGNVLIGYTASSSIMFPSAYVTGRLASDDNPTEPLAKEYELQPGSGSHSGSDETRWGDYSTMTLDPTDDCTFWFTSEYLAAEDSNIWHTVLSRVRFKSCH